MMAITTSNSISVKATERAVQLRQVRPRELRKSVCMRGEEVSGQLPCVKSCHQMRTPRNKPYVPPPWRRVKRAQAPGRSSIVDIFQNHFVQQSTGPTHRHRRTQPLATDNGQLTTDATACNVRG